MSTERTVSVEIPAISDEIYFARLQGRDEISTPFDYSLLIAKELPDIDPLKLLGTAALVTVEGFKTDNKRHFHGYITDVVLEEIRDHAYYRLTLRPWLWFLSLDTDNRIFQDMTTPEIVEKVFGSWPEAKFTMQLQRSYEKRHYCVQYGESDLAFVQRLMDDEGIFYFFEHTEDGHSMKIIDANSALGDGSVAEYPYEADSRVSYLDGEFISRWTPRAQVRTGKYFNTDYDFEKPSFDLSATTSHAIGHEQDKAEAYHYPGRYVQLSQGQKIAERRLEELQADQLRIQMGGTVRMIGAGSVFSLTDFPREEENDKYFVVHATYDIWGEQRRTGESGEETGYHIAAEVSPERITFRPRRRTPWPRMKGPQTARVTGPAGSEIFTDEYSRVKVQFFWDRQGRNDENTTCFIRVSAAWAGAGWGFIQIPRIGHEVIVDFLEGDPDQPIITGRVYNAENPVPYGLPGNASQSGWKSWSTPSSGGFNELRFEDKAGAEEVYFQAEKDHVELIKNDETRTIGHDFAEDVGHDAQQSIGNDRTESVGHDKSVTVGNNQTTNIGVNDDETVGSNRSLTVGANETISIGANSTETIGANHVQTVAIAQAITVGGARADTVGAAEVRSVGASQTNTIGSDRSVTVGGAETHTIGKDDSWTIGGKQAIKIAKDQTVDISGIQSTKVVKDQSTEIGGNHAVKAGKDSAFAITGNYGVKSGKTITIEAADAIVLKTGSAAISMKKDGTINIEGKDITIKGSGKINVKASSDVTVKGSKILNN